MTFSFQKEIREALGITEEDVHKGTKLKKYGGNPTPDQVEQWRINHDNREIDLVSILMIQKIIIQTETKSTTPETKEDTKQNRKNEAIGQVKFFRDYLTRMHGREVNDFVFIPIIAFPNLSTLPKIRSQCYCKKINSEDMDLPRDAATEAKSQETGNIVKSLRRTHSEGGTKTEHQTKRATIFAIEEADMKKDDRARGAPYLGKKYETCASTVQGEGCLFFKWDCEDRPVLQTDTTAGSNCSCGMEPLTISVRQHQKDKIAKRFQVCQAQDKKCEFFLWVNEPKRDCRHCKNQETNGQTIEAEQKTFFKGSSEKGTCKKHFMFKQHVENTTEREEWWKENYNPSTVSNVKVKQDEILRRRLITTSSMVFTRIPRLLSKLTPDSQLILMR